MLFLDDREAISRHITSGGPSAILFYEDWCPFSVLQRDCFERIEPLVPSLVFVKVRMDVLGNAGEIPIRAIPTILFTNGNVVSHIEGCRPQKELLKELAKAFPHLKLTDNDASPGPNLRLPRDINRMGAKGQLEVDGANVELDRVALHILMFLQYLQADEDTSGIFRRNGLTDRGVAALGRFRRQITGGRKDIFGVTREKLESEGYMAKQVSRINTQLKGKGVQPLIEQKDGDYVLRAPLTTSYL